MQIAARNGSIPILELLHDFGGNISSRGPKGDTLFHLAGYNGHVLTMKWLHAKGILPEAVDLHGQTVVHLAARRGEFGVLQYLYEELHVDAALFLTQEDFDGRTALDCLPRHGPEEFEACREYFQMIIAQEGGNIVGSEQKQESDEESEGNIPSWLLP